MEMGNKENSSGLTMLLLPDIVCCERSCALFRAWLNNRLPLPATLCPFGLFFLACSTRCSTTFTSA